ncbi:Protein of unknown function [Pyronema omphalodes CBS 100304]|uniref:Uncharacterized protein n=1 Tax=Pyronema omphalodes (strain CBS 100304) TaxID=1076935 RepID=U4L7Y3_PYROM|nr:Protein of unknown function [Pyronema omphalodes CBS 100304]
MSSMNDTFAAIGNLSSTSHVALRSGAKAATIGFCRCCCDKQLRSTVKRARPVLQHFRASKSTLKNSFLCLLTTTLIKI